MYTYICMYTYIQKQAKVGLGEMAQWFRAHTGTGTQPQDL